MGLVDQLEQAVSGRMGGQNALSPVLRVVTSLSGQNSDIGGLTGLPFTLRARLLHTQ
jgi:hypothetical protein